MSLDLDKRQRAMLREMGVRVWQPMGHAPPATVASATTTPVHISETPVVAAAVTAMDLVASSPSVNTVTATFNQKPVPSRRTPEATASALRSVSGEALWNVGEAQALYADSTSATGPRWLVLAESPVAALQGGGFNPFEGDAGKLLDNMLRAARLHVAGAVLLAPLARRSGGDAAFGKLPQALPGLFAEARPDIVLVMGRLAAIALLQSNEPFGKLRGHVHMIHGVKTVVTQDATVLLRQPADKAKAWEDLCLAMGLVH